MTPAQTPLPPAAPVSRRGHTVTLKLLFIAALVLVLQAPLAFVNDLREARMKDRHIAETVMTSEPGNAQATPPAFGAAEGYRMVYRALKYSVLVLTLTFAAFFLFETVAGLKLHAVHYALVGAALCLFYLALLALGEVLDPGLAYVGAAVASSLLIVLYSKSILRSIGRAGTITGLLAGEHTALFVVLRMEDYALLAGTAALFVALGAVMFFTRNVDWFAQEKGRAVAA